MSGPALPRPLKGLLATIIAVALALTLLVSAASTANADPTDPAQPDPPVSATPGADQGGQVDPTDTATPPNDTATTPTTTATPKDVTTTNDSTPSDTPTATPTDTATTPADPTTPAANTAPPSTGTKTTITPAPTGYIPPSFDTSAINDGTYQSSLNRASTLPSKYNLLTAHPTWLPGVRDQGNFGTCWAFAASESAETSLARNGLTSPTSSVAARQVSTLHLIQSVYYTSTFKANTSNPMAWNGPYLMGGNQYMAAAAWSHWYGAQLESTYPYPTNQSTAPKVISASALKSSNYHLRSMSILPAPRNSNGAYSPANVTTIKQAVFDYGSAYTAFAGSLLLSSYYSASNKSFYDPYNDYPDHAVLIIGWDDTFPASNFASRPPGNGAFLIQNSWGVGQMDYVWLSYYDHSMNESAVFDLISAATTANRQSSYDWTSQYAYDDLGIGGAIVSSTSSITYANKFTAHSDTTLRAAQFATLQPNMSYTVSVYVGNIHSNSATAGGTQRALTTSGAHSITGTMTYAGYQTVTFSKPVILEKGQKFSIVVTLTRQSGKAYGPVEVKYNYGAGPSHLTISAGQSYLKKNGAWEDFTTYYHQTSATGIMGNANIIGLASGGPKYKLTYNPNGGKVATPSQPITYGEKLGTLATPTRLGYSFTGWYASTTGGSHYTSSTLVSSMADITVYAHWKVNHYTVKFKANGGSTPKRGGKKYISKIITFGHAYGPLPTTKRSGYKFLGWYTAKKGGTRVTSATQVITTGTRTLYARWAKKR